MSYRMIMKKTVILLVTLTLSGYIQAKELKSPDGTVGVTVTDSTILISKNGQTVHNH